MLVVSLTCIFHFYINPLIIKVMRKEFNIVSSKDNMLVHFINVGQADAVAINLPDGKIMLIDDGSKEYNVSYVNYLKENVLNSKLNNKIDYLVLTHADADHVGGTLKLLKNFKIGTVFMPKIMSNSATFHEILNYVNKNCNYITLGEGFKLLKDYEITFFESINNTNTNDSSQIIKLKFMNKSFLFTADISSSVEYDYLKLYADELDCDVLKVSHHGSTTATSQKFLDCVSPQYAVISVGVNEYGHPSQEVLNRLKDIKSKTYRTDKDGDVLFLVGKDYELTVLNKIFYISNMTFDYRIYVIVIDIVLFGISLFIIFKKEKKKSKHKSQDFLV